MLRRCVLLAGLCAAAVPASAGAAFTSSQISTPAEGTRFVRTSPADTITVSGTTTGGTVSENVNLRCDQPPGLPAATLPTSPQLQLAGDGAFSTSGASTANATGGCLLRAVPDTFAEESPFAGRWVIFERRIDTADGFDDFVQRDAGGTGIRPLGVVAGKGGGLSETRLTDTPGRRNSYDLFFYAGAILNGDLTVDGQPAQPQTKAVTREAGSVREEDVLTPGVTWTRTTTIGSDGTSYEQTDTLTSTDGKAHTVAAWIGYSALTPGGETPAFGVSWADGAARAVRAPGTQLAGSPGGTPGTLLIDRNAAAADGDALWPRAAVTWDPGPVAVRFGASKEAAARFEGLPVQPGVSTTVLRTRYLVGSRAAELAAGGQRQRDQARAPALTLGGVADGATVFTSSLLMRGTASDTEGVASLVVGGRAVTPAADGSYSAVVALKPGANTITAVATDAAGQATSRALAVTYKDVIAPFLSAVSVPRRTVKAGRSLTVRLRLGEAATVTIDATRAGTRKAARTLRRTAKRGSDSIAFSTRKLKPGRYRLSVTARDASGNASRTFTVTVRVT